MNQHDSFRLINLSKALLLILLCPALMTGCQLPVLPDLQAPSVGEQTGPAGLHDSKQTGSAAQPIIQAGSTQTPDQTKTNPEAPNSAQEEQGQTLHFPQAAAATAAPENGTFPPGIWGLPPGPGGVPACVPIVAPRELNKVTLRSYVIEPPD